MSVYVIRLDGREVELEPRRLADSIFRACLMIGHEDRFIAEEVAQAVVLHLERTPDRGPSSLQEVQDLVEQVLFDTGQIEIARSYRFARQRRREARKLLQVRRRARQQVDATDVELMVDPVTSEELGPWNRERIALALVVETGLDEPMADAIAVAVEERVFSAGIERISTLLIRALVDSELFERNLAARIPVQQLYGMPALDLERMIRSRSRENATASGHNPETISRAIAEQTLRMYALREIFSPEVAAAHLEGRIHLHGLGQALRLGDVVHDLAELITDGLDLVGVPAVSAPPRHVSTLSGQLATYLRAMASYHAGRQRVARMNLAYAPFLGGLEPEELRQHAQELLFGIAQECSAGGGKAVAVDFELVLDRPTDARSQMMPGTMLPGTMLPGPGGQAAGVESEWMPTAIAFARALLQVMKEGDLRGAPFVNPRLIVVTPGAFGQGELDPAARDALVLAAEVAAASGAVVFEFRRPAALPAPGKERAQPARVHGQTVTLNLARTFAAADLTAELDLLIEIALAACAQRRQHLMRLASSKELPLWEMGRSRRGGGGARVDFSRLRFHIGIVGLAEALESIDAPPERAIEILESLAVRLAVRAEALGLDAVLAETPCESAARRLARIDLRISESSTRARMIEEWDESTANDWQPPSPVVRGNRASGDVYYSRGSTLPVDAPVSWLERLRQEGERQRFCHGGAMSTVAFAAGIPSGEAALEIVLHARDRTGVRALSFAVDLIVCNACRRTERLCSGAAPFDPGGASLPRCPSCYAYDVAIFTRVGDGIASLADANPSKVHEIISRRTAARGFPVQPQIRLSEATW